MKWILENATKVIGLLSFSLVVFTTVHDWGYFSVIGPHFRALLSAYDYITNALEWMPSFLFLLVAMTGLSFVAVWLIDRPREAGFGDFKHRRWRRTMFLYAGGLLVLSLAIAGRSLFLAFPANRAIQILAAIGILTAAFTFYVAWSDVKLQKRRALLFPVVATTLIALAYISGTLEAFEAIKRPANVYKVNLKFDRTKLAVLLRTFDKGVLIWNMDSRTAELLRWDQVDGLSHVVTFDGPPAACRMLSRFCAPPVEP